MSKQDRILSELAKVGVPKHGQHQKVCKLLPDILRDDEHIEAAAYGRNSKHWHAILVATDKRVLYIEADMLFKSFDEVPYGIVHGVIHVPAPMFEGITLKTLGQEYSLSYVSKVCATRFVRVIEDRTEKVASLRQDVDLSYEREPQNQKRITSEPVVPVEPQEITLTGKQNAFLQEHSSIVSINSSRTGQLTAQAIRYALFNGVYYIVVSENNEQQSTRRRAKQPITGVIFDRQTLQTMQLSGILTPEVDPITCQYVYSVAAKIATMDAQNYVVYRLTITDIQLTHLN